MRISDWSSDVCSSDLNGSRGRDYPLFELRRRKAACPAIEKLHGVYTCFHLSRQILCCEIRNGVDDCSKSGWVSIGYTARKAVILEIGRSTRLNSSHSCASSMPSSA